MDRKSSQGVLQALTAQFSRLLNSLLEGRKMKRQEDLDRFFLKTHIDRERFCNMMEGNLQKTFTVTK